MTIEELIKYMNQVLQARIERFLHTEDEYDYETRILKHIMDQFEKNGRDCSKLSKSILGRKDMVDNRQGLYEFWAEELIKPRIEEDEINRQREFIKKMELIQQLKAKDPMIKKYKGRWKKARQ